MFIKRSLLAAVVAASLAAAFPAFAQEADPAGPPDESQAAPPRAQPANPPADMQQPAPPPAPPSSGWRRFGQAPQPVMAPLPPKVTVPAGTWVTIRVDQPLDSDHNQAGDFFSASLAQPVVVDGIVVARRGQMVGGVVSEAVKAGRAKGVSRLKLELTELSLADGKQVPIKSQLIERRGDTSTGRDAAAIGTTTGMGAAIGAAADGGFGAGMGAIAGAAASTIGVLVTRGRPTVVYPETALTFRLEAPITVSTVSAPDAFQPVTQSDYGQRMQYRAARAVSAPPYYSGGYGYPYPYWYGGYWGYPYWGWGGWGWGYPGVVIGFRGGYHHGFHGHR